MNKLNNLCLAAGLMLTSAHAQAADIVDSRDSVEGYEHSIRINGKLMPGDEVVFRTIALEIPLTSRVEVIMTSGGGAITALEIGRIIRQRGWTTRAVNQCNSMCAYIWLAGNKRVIYPGAVMGFHAIAEDCGSGVCQRVSGFGNALLGAYLNELGFGEKAIQLFTKATLAETTWMTPAMFTQYGIKCEIYGMMGKSEPPPAQPAKSSLLEAFRKILK
jgi:hypothetical protein